MALTLVGYHATDNNNQVVTIIVPRWDGYQSTTRGSYTLAQYIAQYPDFPVEATWFTYTEEQKAALIENGVPNVYAIKTIVDSGASPWTFADGKYIEFSYSGSSAYATFHTSNDSRNISLSKNDIDDTSGRRAICFPSDTIQTFANNTRGIGYWTISNAAPYDETLFPDGPYLYFYYTGSEPERAIVDTFAEVFWNGLEPIPTGGDPYEPGGTSETGGGTGTFDLSSDSVDFPDLPTLTAVSTGLVSVYTPTLAQLNALASYMWNANVTDVDWWKKLVANPLDLILGLSIVPCAVPTATAQNVKVGLIDTGISINKASTQFVEVNCGSINVEEIYGAALDYLPFRKTSIYLPFIGTRTISTDDIMGKTVHVKYHIDLLSGACTALVKCGDAVLYQYSGACAVSLPLTGETFTNVITSTIQLAASVSATVASGGAAAGVTAANAANSVLSMKPTVERAGGVSGAAGQLGIMTPYLIGEVPRQSVPENYNQYAGYPSNILATLGSLTGYTEVEKIFIKDIEATQAELDELETILKGGFII